MADFTLSNGDEVTFDFHKINVREYRELLSPECPKDKEDELVSRMSGFTVDKLLDLPQDDYQNLLTAFIEKITKPIGDPKNL